MIQVVFQATFGVASAQSHLQGTWCHSQKGYKLVKEPCRRISGAVLVIGMSSIIIIWPRWLVRMSIALESMLTSPRI